MCACACLQSNVFACFGCGLMCDVICGVVVLLCVVVCVYVWLCVNRSNIVFACCVRGFLRDGVWRVMCALVFVLSLFDVRCVFCWRFNV